MFIAPPVDAATRAAHAEQLALQQDYCFLRSWSAGVRLLQHDLQEAPGGCCPWRPHRRLRHHAAQLRQVYLDANRCPPPALSRHARLAALIDWVQHQRP